MGGIGATYRITVARGEVAATAEVSVGEVGQWVALHGAPEGLTATVRGLCRLVDREVEIQDRGRMREVGV